MCLLQVDGTETVGQSGFSVSGWNCLSFRYYTKGEFGPVSLISRENNTEQYPMPLVSCATGWPL